jgi:hypothetical protein
MDEEVCLKGMTVVGNLDDNAGFPIPIVKRLGTALHSTYSIKVWCRPLRLHVHHERRHNVLSVKVGDEEHGITEKGPDSSTIRFWFRTSLVSEADRCRVNTWRGRA